MFSIRKMVGSPSRFSIAEGFSELLSAYIPRLFDPEICQISPQCVCRHWCINRALFVNRLSIFAFSWYPSSEWAALWCNFAAGWWCPHSQKSWKQPSWWDILSPTWTFPFVRDCSLPYSWHWNGSCSEPPPIFCSDFCACFYSYCTYLLICCFRPCTCWSLPVAYVSSSAFLHARDRSGLTIFMPRALSIVIFHTLDLFRLNRLQDFNGLMLFWLYFFWIPWTRFSSSAHVPVAFWSRPISWVCSAVDIRSHFLAIPNQEGIPISASGLWSFCPWSCIHSQVVGNSFPKTQEFPWTSPELRWSFHRRIPLFSRWLICSLQNPFCQGHQTQLNWLSMTLIWSGSTRFWHFFLVWEECFLCKFWQKTAFAWQDGSVKYSSFLSFSIPSRCLCSAASENLMNWGKSSYAPRISILVTCSEVRSPIVLWELSSSLKYRHRSVQWEPSPYMVFQVRPHSSNCHSSDLQA